MGTQMIREILMSGNNVWGDDTNESLLQTLKPGIMIQHIGALVYLSSGIMNAKAPEYQDYYEFWDIAENGPVLLIDSVKRDSVELNLSWVNGYKSRPVTVNLTIRPEFIEELRTVGAEFTDTDGRAYRIVSSL